MPHRLSCIAIVLFWLATTGWLAFREIGPHFFSNAAPRVTIELADEAFRQPTQVRWRVWRNGQEIGTATTAISYRETDDSFALTCTLRDVPVLQQPAVVIKKMTNTQRVNRLGRQIGSESNVTAVVAGFTFDIALAGRMDSDKMMPTCHVESAFGQWDPELPAVPLAHAGTLSPLHPVHKITGLWKGRTWRQPLADPLSDALAAALQAYAKGLHVPGLNSVFARTERQILTAEVTGPALLAWDGAEQRCFVIEYRGDGYSARTWVRRADGLVVQQEASAIGDEWKMVRQ